jgi:hypothetical protein
MQVTISFKRRLHFPIENSAKIYRELKVNMTELDPTRSTVLRKSKRSTNHFR